MAFTDWLLLSSLCQQGDSCLLICKNFCLGEIPHKKTKDQVMLKTRNDECLKTTPFNEEQDNIDVFQDFIFFLQAYKIRYWTKK